jgi:hypothetical protein
MKRLLFEAVTLLGPIGTLIAGLLLVSFCIYRAYLQSKHTFGIKTIRLGK